MKLTKKSEYACLALINLSRNYKKGLIRIEDISVNEKIPKKYLEQILLILKKAGYVESKRGVGGGYRLSKPPEDISVAEVLGLMEEPITPININKKLKELFGRVRICVIDELEVTKFSDLI